MLELGPSGQKRTVTGQKRTVTGRRLGAVRAVFLKADGKADGHRTKADNVILNPMKVDNVVYYRMVRYDECPRGLD